MLKFIPARTALILIDLQNWIVGRELSPHTGDDVIERSVLMAQALRAAGGTVILVRVAFSAGYADALKTPVDEAMNLPEGGIPEQALAFDGRLGPVKADLIITKRQWGAFHGTELDLQLRRRGIDTLIIGGIATNFGVEATVREAYAHGYAVIVPEDASSTMSEEMHRFSIGKIMPRLSRIRPTAEIVEAIEAA